LRNCTSARYAVNKGRMVRLAEYSRDALVALRAETGIAYDDRQKGTLQLFRTQKQLDGAQKDIAVLREGGVAFELLDRAGCIAAEPGLAAAADRIVGGLRLPGDETGDCFRFTNSLADMARAKGVTFRTGVEIRSLVTNGRHIEAVSTSEGMITGDAFVVALGSYSPALVRPLGLRLPIYPVKGYSITAPITDATHAPQSTVMDETYKIAITRLGGRLRAGGMAELAGFDKRLHAKRQNALHHSVGDLFAGGADLSRSEFWCGLRPMTPDGTPIIGRAGADNLWLNTGHGTLGWTMGAGSGRVLSDMISGRETEIATADLGYERYLPTTGPVRTKGGWQPA
ncbi:D-amino acid dehydrogenase, partial [Phaeovulum sp.]|uniref:D-amino acid dehydrogenase n=1 Tax=Phaeovulum sp. TaxID=2934796 RepID=UPI0039E4CA3E